MNCSDCTPHLIDHAYGELPEAHAGPVSRHLATCSTCALEFCRLRADLDGVARVYSESPGAAVAAKLRARVETRFSPNWRQRVVTLLRRPIPAYGAMAAAAIPVAVWLGLSAAGPGTESKRPTPLGPVLIEDYDGRELLRVDPHLL